MSEQTMWAVKRPDGRLSLSTIAMSEGDAVARYQQYSRGSWKAAQKIGYCCVEVEIRETGRVRITEVQDGGSDNG